MGVGAPEQSGAFFSSVHSVGMHRMPSEAILISNRYSSGKFGFAKITTPKYNTEFGIHFMGALPDYLVQTGFGVGVQKEI